MEEIRTIKIKLNIPVDVILDTVEACTKAYNHICEVGWNDSDFNSISLHAKTYKTVREYLPSQLAISSRMKASETLKAVIQRKRKGLKTTCPKSKMTSIRYDSNSFNIWFDRKECSLLTIHGRIKIPIEVPEYFNRYISWKRGSAELIIRNSKVFLNITFNRIVEDAIPTGEVVGVDRGIKHIAVTSNNEFFTGEYVENVRKRYRKLRSDLQSKNTKSSKRHLRKIKSKENRFMTDVNHQVTKRIVDGLEKGTTLALEDLGGIRESSKKFRKEQKIQVNTWAYFQFETFLKYKASAKGCLVDYVDARYTSRKCSGCGHVDSSNRKTQSGFKCVNCGFQLHADLNASRNIRDNYLKATRLEPGLPVNQPIVVDGDILPQAIAL